MDIVKLLFENDSQHTSRDLMWFGVRSGNVDIVKLLLDHNIPRTIQHEYVRLLYSIVH